MRFPPEGCLLPIPFALIGCCLSFLLRCTCAVAEHGGVQDFNVGVVLDLGSLAGKISLTCINMAVSDFYAAHPNSNRKLVLHTRDSMGDVVGAAFAGVDLLKNEQVRAIVGPQTSDEAMFLADLGTKSNVTIFSFSATSPAVSPVQNPYFVRAVPNDSAQARPIAAVVGAFGWKRVVLVYEDTNYGAGAVPFLVDAFKEVDARVHYRCVIRPSASDDEILKELYKLMTMQTRVFVVHMGWSLGPRLFSHAKQVGMMSEGYVWIVTDGLAGLLDSMDPSSLLDSMQGVIGVKPYIPMSQSLRDFKRRWRLQFLLENSVDGEATEPNTDGLRAYDTIWALALVAEASGVGGPRFTRPPETTESSNDLAAVGVSETGRGLLDAILKTSFDGLMGKFHLLDGELHAPGYTVVNVIGQKQREVGYWTPFHGLSKQLNWYSRKNYTTSRDDLWLIIWPGEPHFVPRGWENPTGEMKMRVGVPRESGFDSILKVEFHPVTNETIVSGYVIEVFEAAVSELPYAIPIEYVPFVGDYDSLVYQIHLQKFDAVVGDITITSNRSQFVDFTLPYTPRGVSMVVPVKDHRGMSGWIFLKPLVLELWLAAGAFFVFTGAVVWVLEHRINEEFRGPPVDQVGSLFYFSFSTLVFAHREKVVSNLSRVVVVVWLFVVLVLTSSYTASLASMFTVRRLQPKFADIGELQRNGENVGYPRESFVLGVLKKQGFQESQLKPYLSPQDYAAALATGSRNGGVAAVMDEIPYLQVFLKEYCSNYTMTSLTHNTEGLGFAFPKGSPLVNDLSRVILNMTEGNKMSEIQKKWFGDQNTCPEKDKDISMNILDFKRFWGLFFITGTASTTSLLIFIAAFSYKNWHVLRREMAGMSVWQKLLAILEHVDRRECPLESSPNGSTTPQHVLALDRGQTPPSIDTSYDSPFCMSDHTCFQGTPSRELDRLSPLG
uniref:Glutamate receptor n=1 Tax=Anthurium amnicola TaxID=1678845 RepID=A0A1D1Y6Y1_9ARAE